MGHMSRWGQIWLGYNVVSYCHTSRSIPPYFIPCRPVLFYLAVQRATPPTANQFHVALPRPLSLAPHPPNHSPPIILSSPVLLLFIPSRHLPLFPLPPSPLPSLSTSFHLFPSRHNGFLTIQYLSIPSKNLSIPLPRSFHTLSIPPRPLPSFRIFAHPVTPHSVLFLYIAPLPVFFANPLLSISYPIPFAVFSFPFALF